MDVVLILDHGHVNGGQAKVAIESALGLAARGHRVDLLAAVGPVDPRLAAAGIGVTCLGQPDITTATSKLAFAGQMLWNGPAERALAGLLAGRDPRHTLVHMHAWAKALSPSIFAAIRRAGLPALYTMHEFFLVCPNGGLYDYRRHEICHRRPLSGACMAANCDMRSYPRKAMRLARHLLLERVARWPEGIRDVVTISALQEEVAGPLLPPGVRRHRIDNPIAVEDAGPKPAGASGPITYVGRLSTEKGVVLLAEAARLAGIAPVFVGDGPEAETLRRLYPEARLLGWRDAAGVRDALRAASALVFPSIWYEGQPLTVYEALALGTPVVVSDACAGREAVADGETGYWFPSGDAAALAERLTRLRDPATVTALGAEAYRRYWAKPLTLSAHCDRLEEVYGLVLRQGSAEPAAARAGDRPRLAPVG
ncbi:glycosyltransferase family 4 protein [Methylobacterium nodulans]|uniref:Glycosyl transferase group 1 n=1 Tax=Methylobacterium nodulans (strain LMG 21967 / CNCM I-2342 / ORS 2060) TaxID=460265 RepID=B8ICC6_METNO|nr:glycosyltransferase family 4 protein [Methylobacterium nodulans]ACL55514.1 glycosyl transferase group 1 [Methylobacterium nodulans ORS 2060]